MRPQEIIENAGYECRNYSGRGMCGKYCLGVVVKNMGEFIGNIFYEIADLDWAYCEEMGDLFGSMRTDNMGLDTILYFPGTAYSEEDDEEDETDEEMENAEIAEATKAAHCP